MPALREFTRGLITAGDAWKRPANSLAVAQNVEVSQGNLTPLKGLGSAESTGGGWPGGTIAWMWKLGSTWLGSTTVRYAVRWQSSYLAYLPIAGGQPQWTDGTTTATLGIQGPTAAAVAASGGAGNITGTSLTWVYTYVTALGQESAPSPPSTGTSSYTANDVDLTSVSTGPAGTTARKIYRVLSGTYFYVGQIADNTTTTYTDDARNDQLTDPLLTEQTGASPAMSVLFPTPHLARLWGASNNTLYWTEPGAPHAWSISNLKLQGNIVTGATAGRDPYSDSSGSVLLVLTEDKPWFITGTDETNFAQVEASNNYGCSAALSLVKTDKGLVWFHSKHGLILYDGSQFVRLMFQRLADTYPASLSTTGMHAAYFDGRYHLFHSGGTLICDLRSGEPVFTTSDQTAGSSYTHTDGVMYVSSGNSVYAWGTGSNRTMTVRTQEIANDEVEAVAQVWAASVQLATAATTTAQWYEAGTAHGSTVALTGANNRALCWVPFPVSWNRTALELTGAYAVGQIDVNPKESA